jgi:hypothetical protein
MGVPEGVAVPPEGDCLGNSGKVPEPSRDGASLSNVPEELSAKRCASLLHTWRTCTQT